MPRVCVAIPTFRRPQLLEALLRGIAAQTLPIGYVVDVLVVDNDTWPSARSVVDAVSSSFPVSLTYVHVAEPGLSSVRNFALAYAAAGYDFLAMIDDDEFPQPQWLGELLRVRSAAEADAVVGPVPGILADGAPRWIRRGAFYDLPSYPDGTTITFGYSGNCLLRVSSLVRLGVTFDLALNFAGGEDLLFFRQLIGRGGRLVYASRAIASETIGPERLRLSYLMKLNFRRGNTLSICDRRMHGTLAGLALRAIKSYARFAVGAASLIPLATTRGRAGAVRALCDMSQGLGAMYGLVGRIYNAYGRDDVARS